MTGGTFMGIGGWEFVIIVLLFVVLIGPQRLPEYTQRAMGWIRDVRRWADQSKATIEDEMGIAVDDLKKYDPRQYDPRKIIREAWDSTGLEEDIRDFGDVVKSSTSATASAVTGAAAVGAAASASSGSDSAKSTPFDPEAT
ncbi:MAG: translocase [Dermabacter sp.]|nr:translocase [Dermabacter sp.]